MEHVGAWADLADIHIFWTVPTADQECIDLVGIDLVSVCGEIPPHCFSLQEAALHNMFAWCRLSSF